MKKIIFALVAIMFSASVFSHGPTPQKVQESVTIAASPQKTWEALKNYSELKKIMKVRSFKDKLMKAKYELIEKDVPFSDYNAQIKVKKGANDNESIVQWTARFYRTYKLNPPIPEGQDDATAVAAVKKIVGPGLEGFKKYVESQ
ncbi:MAG: SRPBCC family protein [Betaproteobacteria bacterium]|nr:SRPBCC family protein [Betaproteobacteria bacterium]